MQGLAGILHHYCQRCPEGPALSGHYACTVAKGVEDWEAENADGREHSVLPVLRLRVTPVEGSYL